MNSAQQTDKDTINLAIIAALTNVKNCARIGSFTENSIKNFKHMNADEAEILEALFGKIETVDDWLEMLYEFAVVTDKKVLEVAEKYLTVASNKIKLTSKIRTLLKLEPLNEDEETETDYLNDDEEESTSTQNEENAKINDNSEPEQVKRNKAHTTNNTTSMDNILLQAFNNLTKSFQITKALRIISLKSTKQNTSEWFDMFDRHTANWDDSSKLNEVITWFEDTALRTFELLKDNEKLSYTKLRKCMIDKLKPHDSMFRAKANFYSMKQDTNETVEEYAHRMYSQKKEWPVHEYAMFEKDMCKVFKDGLIPVIAKQMVSYEPKDFDGLLKIAKKTEKLVIKENETVIEAAISIKPKEIKCFECDKIGHMSVDCRSKENNSSTPQFPCMFCGKSNHFPINCYFYKNYQQTYQTNNSQVNYKVNKFNKMNNNDNNKDSFDRSRNNKHNETFSGKIKTTHQETVIPSYTNNQNKKCFKCGKEGHYAKNCQSLNSI
jgi:hypothetical protein